MEDLNRSYSPIGSQIINLSINDDSIYDTGLDKSILSQNTSILSSNAVKPLLRKKKRRRKRLSNKEKNFHLAKVTSVLQNQTDNSVKEEKTIEKSEHNDVKILLETQERMNTIPELSLESIKSTILNLK